MAGDSQVGTRKTEMIEERGNGFSGCGKPCMLP